MFIERMNDRSKRFAVNACLILTLVLAIVFSRIAQQSNLCDSQYEAEQFVTWPRPPWQSNPLSADLAILALEGPVLKELGIERGAPVVADIKRLAHACEEEMLREAVVKREDVIGVDKEGDVTILRLQAKYRAQLKRLLTSNQYVRLLQIEWRFKGVSWFEDPDLARLLRITPKQKKQLEDLITEMIAGEPPSSDAQTENQMFGAEHLQRTKQILSVAQQNKFAKLIGKPFDLTQIRSEPQ